MTIGVPGNVPYVLTVGAMTDSMTAQTMVWTSMQISPVPCTLAAVLTTVLMAVIT